MAKFRIGLRRTVWETVEVEYEAKDEQSARSWALAEAVASDRRQLPGWSREIAETTIDFSEKA